MKILQVHTFYEIYLQYFYALRQGLALQSYDFQLNSILLDGFGSGHTITPFLTKLGYDAEITIANCSQLQNCWLSEAGIKQFSTEDRNRTFEFARLLIDSTRPDILYLSDPVSFDSRLLRSLSWRPKLVMGWRAAPSGHCDWSEFDVMLSCLSVCRQQALQLGAKTADYFFPGLPVDISRRLQHQPKVWDVVFCGQWSLLHQKRNRYIHAVARFARECLGKLSVGCFLLANPGELSPEVAVLNQGPRWGMDMYQTLYSGRIVLNATIDMAGDEAPNMRLFEAVGVGSFVLTEYHPNISQFFTPGVEIETFSSEEELIEKISYYLAHPEEREAIARRGQARCLQDYSMERRAEAFDALIRRHLTRKSTTMPVSTSLQHSPGSMLAASALTDHRNRVKQLPQDPSAYFALGQALQGYGRLDAAQRAQWQGWRMQWGDRDYISPQLALVNADHHFPHLSIGNTAPIAWPYLRKEVLHNWYVDRRAPTVGFLSRDEAHILYNLALQFRGQRALEIGCWMGWSACHLALAGVELDVVDPLLERPEFAQSVRESLQSAGVLDRVNLVAGYSPQAVEALAAGRSQPWPLIFIDGNHEHPGPLDDAIACARLAAPDAMIVFHDLASPDVARGLDYLRSQGWNVLVYQTMQIMGVAWRGNVEPIQHQPDPQVNWTLPSHLQGYPISGMVNFSSSSNPSSAGIPNPQVVLPQVQSLMQQSVDFYNKNQPVEALRAVEQAVAFRIFIPELYYLRAVCLVKVGRCEEALAAAREELRLNPSHLQVRAFIDNLAQAIARPEQAVIPTVQRPWNTSLNRETLMSIQNASHNYAYRGVPMIKNPFDFALYPMLLWNVKPRTIIEIGSKAGGSGLWLGDLMNNFGLEGHIYSLDIVRVDTVSHPRVTFMEGNGRDLGATLSSEFVNSLPRPLMIIEDADHAYETSIGVLEFFHPYLQMGEYIVIEDGIISDIAQDPSYNSGPHRALKEFLGRYSGYYEMDSDYCDFFGYNLTWCTNGFLKKVQA